MQDNILKCPFWLNFICQIQCYCSVQNLMPRFNAKGKNQKFPSESKKAATNNTKH